MRLLPFFLALSLCLRVSYCEDLPEFDPDKMYQVPGSTLNELRAEWIELEKALAELETSFEEYRTTSETEIARLRASDTIFKVLTVAGIGATVGLGIAYVLK